MKSLLLVFFLNISFFAVHQEKTILFLGDSLTDGDGVAKERCFPALVGQKIGGIASINQGRSGWATSSYLRRWDEVEQKLPGKVDVIFIQLGANDLRIDGHSDSTVQLCQVNMEEIVKRLMRIYPDAEIVLMSSTKLDATLMTESIRAAQFGKHSNKFIRKIGKGYKKLAKEKGLGFIDLHKKIPIHSTHDGAHLNEKGHEQVAREVMKYLKKKKILSE